MKPNEIFRCFCLMGLFAVGMLVSYVVYVITSSELAFWGGVLFMAAGIATMVFMIIKMRHMFKGDSGVSDDFRTWRSYR